MTDLKTLAQKILSGSFLEPEEISVIAAIDQNEFLELLFWANTIRQHFFGRRISFCCIAPGRRGGCSEDCAWCGQSTHRHLRENLISQADSDDLLIAAQKAQCVSASCFCVVNSGRRPTEEDLRAIEDLNKTLATEGIMQACVSLGELDEATAYRLRSAGVICYNHNLETSRTHFARVVSTHRFDDRLKTLRAARAAGMDLCCGGIFGIGETWIDRIELALTLRDEVQPNVVPLNFLDARPGTPLADALPLTPQQCLHIIALFRFTLPTVNIKIAGGRHLLRDLQSWVFYAGATSLMVGNYLTTSGRNIEMDHQMVMDLGLKLVLGE